MRQVQKRRLRGRDPERESPLSAALAERDRDTISMVERAVARRDVLLAYQPVVQTAQPARPAFHEGLIRVLDDTGRIIPARDFIGTTEATETGRILDCLSLDLGLSALRHDLSLRLSINMSARSIAYPRWMKTLQRGLLADPELGERLILEITEASAMIMPDAVTVFMANLQDKGVSFALDEFGAGLTSFRYLRSFYFDILKIDGQFIRGVATDPDNQCLTQAMLDIARRFDMFAVASRVETAADAAWLTAAGVDAMQGYYFGAPTVTPPSEMPRPRISA